MTVYYLSVSAKWQKSSASKKIKKNPHVSFSKLFCLKFKTSKKQMFFCADLQAEKHQDQCCKKFERISDVAKKGKYNVLSVDLSLCMVTSSRLCLFACTFRVIQVVRIAACV